LIVELIGAKDAATKKRKEIRQGNSKIFVEHGGLDFLLE
jgi:hypothetical protein